MLHRLKIAGRDGTLFDDAALGALFEHSGGIPRRINILAGNALIEGFGRGAEAVGADIVEDVARDGA